MSNKKECPATGSTSHFLLNLAMIALGAAGLYFLSAWVAVAYVAFFFVYFFVIMPVKACQYCYYRTDVTLEEWKDKYVDLHATSMKMWGSGIFIIWSVPVIGILISFLLNFSPVAVLCLAGFIVLLIVSNKHLRQQICSQCAILEVCPIRS